MAFTIIMTGYHDIFSIQINDTSIQELDFITITNNMYDSLIIKTQQNKYSKAVYNLFFLAPIKYHSFPNNHKNQATYLKKHRGKTINEIKVINLTQFENGINLRSTTINNFYTNTLNKTHTKTRNRVIHSYLLFSEGDYINPEILEDNERLLRGLSFIRDARIEVSTLPLDTMMANVYIYVQDQWSKGIGLELDDINTGYMAIYDKNIAGTAQQAELRGYFNTDYDPSFGKGAFLSFRNVFKTFINVKLQHVNTVRKGISAIEISKSFLTPEVKYAGKINIQNEYKYSNIDYLDTIHSNIYTNYNNYDIWFGRSFRIKKYEANTMKRSRIIISGRYYNYNFSDGPDVTENSFYSYQKREILLGSIAYSRLNYYKTSLIYNYGKTEDIPYGVLSEIHLGYDRNEFSNRTYAASKLVAGRYFNKIGYLNNQIIIGGFYNKGLWEQAMLLNETRHISRLFAIREYSLRNHLNIRFIQGYNRFKYEYLTLNNNNGIPGLSSSSFKGLKKITINNEIVCFSPIYIYGFRFVFFSNIDLGMISFNGKLISYDNLYSGLGLGLRLRNEFLVFETFQIKFSFFPKVPDDSHISWISISDEQYKIPRSFNFDEPQIIQFR